MAVTVHQKNTHVSLRTAIELVACGRCVLTEKNQRQSLAAVR